MDPRVRPLLVSSIWGSPKSGSGSGASAMLGGAATTVLVPHPHPAFFFLPQLPLSFLMFIIPQTMRMNTRVCTRRPRVEGHPVGVEIQEPKIRLTMRKVSGFATMKNVRPDMMEMINFSCCFLPLQPQPQSLNRPMITFDIYQQKK